MKPVLIAACAALALSACATDGVGYGFGGGRYDAYYDGFYGPYSDGYWDGDGAYWYSTGRGRPFARDDGHHFQRGPSHGFHGVRGASGGGFHGGGGEHGGGEHGGGGRR